MCPVEGCTFATAFQSGIKHHITNRHVDPEVSNNEGTQYE